MWNNIAKPNTRNWTNLSKDVTNLALYGSAIYGVSKYGRVNAYTNVPKPTGSSWTNIAKPS